MNQALINDALMMLRQRFAPLEQYQYPANHIALALVLLGIVAAAGAPKGMGEPLNVILFFTVSISIETLLYARFMRWWLQRGQPNAIPPLTGTVIAASAIQLLDPLSSWLPDDAANIVSMTIAMLGLWILVSAMAAGTGIKKMRILLGTLLFAPVAIFMSVTLMNAGSNMGMINLPKEIRTALEQADAQKDSKAKQETPASDNPVSNTQGSSWE